MLCACSILIDALIVCLFLINSRIYVFVLSLEFRLPREHSEHIYSASLQKPESKTEWYKPALSSVNPSFS